MARTDTGEPRTRLDGALTAASKTVLIGAATLTVVALLARAAGVSPFDVYRALVVGAVGTPLARTETLLHAAPILFTGLAAAWGFRAGLFNIGAEGQFLWGALAAAVAGRLYALPPILAPVIALAAGAAAGALWAYPAARLKTSRGAPEVATTLLLNFVALNLTTWLAAGPLRDLEKQNAQTFPIGEAFYLPLLPGARLHLGVILAAVTAAALFVVIQYTRVGFQVRLVGNSPGAARSSGVSPARVWTLALLQSGALAGLGGAVEVLGVHHHFQAGFSPGYGFEGIAVAILGLSQPLLVVLSALFWGGLANGAVEVEISTGVSKHLVTVLQALVVLLVAIRAWPGAWRPGWQRRPSAPQQESASSASAGL